MNQFLSVAFDGVVYSSWLFLMAAGLTLIYGVMRILNIAHGSFYAIGAYAQVGRAGRRLAAGYGVAASYCCSRWLLFWLASYSVADRAWIAQAHVRQGRSHSAAGHVSRCF